MGTPHNRSSMTATGFSIFLYIVMTTETFSQEREHQRSVGQRTDSGSMSTWPGRVHCSRQWVTQSTLLLLGRYFVSFKKVFTMEVLLWFGCSSLKLHRQALAKSKMKRRKEEDTNKPDRFIFSGMLVIFPATGRGQGGVGWPKRHLWVGGSQVNTKKPARWKAQSYHLSE